MVPFMLGRPFGEPNDMAFQKRVLLQALALIESPAGPVILAHFPDDNPSWTVRAGWRASADLPAPAVPDSPAAWEAALRDELAAVHPAWVRFTRRFQFGDVVCQQITQKLPGAATAQIDNRHVGHVEHTGIGAHRVVLINLRAVVQRHHPAMEVHHAGAA